MSVFSAFSSNSSFGLPLLGVVEGGTGKEGSLGLPPQSGEERYHVIPN